MRFALCFLYNIQASPPEIQPLDDAIVFLRDHSENTTVSKWFQFSLFFFPIFVYFAFISDMLALNGTPQQ